MTRIVIKGGHIVSPVEERMCELLIEDGLICSFGGAFADDDQRPQVIDASGCWVTPGLIDLQVNGAPPCNFWDDPDVGQVEALAVEMARAGVTTILPTLITDDLQHLQKNIKFLEQEIKVGPEQLGKRVDRIQSISKSQKGSVGIKERALPVRMPGIHLEGPCLSPERPGVHPKEHIQPLTVEVLGKILSKSVKLVTLAPELDPTGKALSFVQSSNVVVALGHSNADYDEARQAFDRGIAMVTHTFNAMAGIHHRAPGAVTAALLDDRVSCCLICDGQHLAPAAAALILKTKGVRRSILVTDIAKIGTSQGGLVGSSILLDAAVRNVVSWGIATFPEAISMATLNPARAMGWEGSIGSIAVGKQADVVVWNKKNLKIEHVISGGNVLF